MKLPSTRSSSRASHLFSRILSAGLPGVSALLIASGLILVQAENVTSAGDEKVSEKASEKSAEKTAEKSAEKSAETSTDRSAEAGSNQASEKTAEKASEKATDKSEESSKSASVHERGCIVDTAAIEDLHRRREELDGRQKAMAQKESELKSREAAIEEELKRLEDMKASIVLDRTASNAQSEERMSKLVETLENMSPKKASEVLQTVDEKLAVIAMTRISTAKLSKIMNNFDPERAAHLSELMTGHLNSKKKVPAAGALASAPTSQKGEARDGSVESDASRKPASSR